MADDKTNRGPSDREQVNLQQPYEAAYWTERFSVTRAELEAAVRAVGPRVAELERYLQGQRRAG